MTTDAKRAFLCGLRDLMVRHSVRTIEGFVDGQIYVGYGSSDIELYDLGTPEQILEEMEDKHK